MTPEQQAAIDRLRKTIIELQDRITRLEALLRAAIPWIGEAPNRGESYEAMSKAYINARSYFEEKHE